MIDKISYVIMLLSIIGTTANAFKKKWCFYIWIVTNAFWCVYDIYIGSYSQSIQYVVYFGLAIVGLINWRKDKAERHRGCSLRKKRRKKMAEYFKCKPGEVYMAACGGYYVCISTVNTYDYVMMRIGDGWNFNAHGVKMDTDGHILWDYSSGGRFQK